MPVTPFHFGPGVFLKSVAPARFSWAMFALSNIVIDLEPISYYLITGDPVHGYLHTYAGATALALLCAAFCRQGGERLLRFWNSRLSPGQARWLSTHAAITPGVAMCSALLGTWSHIALDSIMHADVMPFWPLSSTNDFRGLVSLDTLHFSCVLVGVWGIARLSWLRKAELFRQ